MRPLRETPPTRGLDGDVRERQRCFQSLVVFVCRAVRRDVRRERIARIFVEARIPCRCGDEMNRKLVYARCCRLLARRTSGGGGGGERKRVAISAATHLSARSCW